MRVRGLKLSAAASIVGASMSHPVRVRGLKHVCRERNRFQLASHPVRVRGLKLKLASVLGKTIDVAPREGAWIETDTADTGQLDSESHPVRVRGLKRYIFSIVR